MPSALFETLLLNSTSGSLPRATIPSLLYGCAWKQHLTSDLVSQALRAGFTGIDVAAQPKHYREDLAGVGIRHVLREGKLKREDIFIQTKFTPIGGQDPTNLPYDPSASITEQVRTSIASSLNNLRHSDSAGANPYIDCLVLHSPLPTLEQTLECWRTCEQHVPRDIRALGISNTSLPTLKALFENSAIKPAVVQNRFYSDTLYEVPLREYCREKGIIFQSFWTLSANPNLLRCRPVAMLGKSAAVESAVALYCLVLGLEDLVILNGTKSHMETDLEGIKTVSDWAAEHPPEWEDVLKQFRSIIGENNQAISLV